MGISTSEWRRKDFVRAEGAAGEATKGMGAISTMAWYQQSQRNFNGYGNHQTFVDPSIEFKSKYEKSCQRLGIPYDADKYQIKLAYRKKAKEYHPDLNKSPDATRLFQQINDAYDFLSDGNIERYKGMR